MWCLIELLKYIDGKVLLVFHICGNRFTQEHFDKICEEHSDGIARIEDIESNHKNYNFLDCDWFKTLLFSTNSLDKLLSDSLLLDSTQSYYHYLLFQSVDAVETDFLFYFVQY